ncbi:MAG: hypothetical protein DSY85_13445 [Marinomonas sp.]|nr:MAG: hypothetical protein DSY85_13445 [Marinomonas sp.]
MIQNDLNLNYTARSPIEHKSKMGYSFLIEDDKWKLDNSVVINFLLLPDFNSESLIGFKKTLCRYAEEMSASFTNNIFAYFVVMLRTTGVKEVNLKAVSMFKASLSVETEYKLAHLRVLFLSWYEYGYAGISVEVIEYLEKLTLKCNVRGKAVITKCPYSGAYTSNEQRALLDWCTNAFVNNVIGLDAFSAFVALLFTGRRPVQIRYLRFCDLIATEIKAGQSQSVSYEVNIPRAKQRGTKFREAFSQIEVNEELYSLLLSQAHSSIGQIEKRLGQELPLHLKKQVPIYLATTNLIEIPNFKILEDALNNDYLHLSSQGFSKLIQRICALNQAKSERTNDFIHISAKRFRYTKGTNLARLGVSGVALARALDHSDIQSISAYVENTPEVADSINEMIAPALAPLAQAFAGTLINSERDAIRANDPHSRVKNHQSKAIGNCGTHAFCVSGYRACYTCVKFQPWKDAPHDEVRREIIAEREQQRSLGVSDLVIQSTDRLLLAVEQVIQICETAKKAEGLSIGK